MNSLRQTSLAVFAFAGALAGCAGSSHSDLNPSAAGPANRSTTQALSQPDLGGRCSDDNGVRVKPCNVQLTLSNPTQTVTAKGGMNGSFTVRDMKCTRNGVAEIAGSGDTYQVTAGTTSGTCFAIFVDRKGNGNRVGKARLTISNKL
ncbi:MAG TPA: hypothetical protein VGF98_14715 [Candidatus Tumulicola sp.]|jgi:hypothetical protein